MGFKFGKRSIDNLDTCHRDLQKIAKLAITRSSVDFGVSEGHRSIERQQQLFQEGKSKIDGVKRLSKHNHNPSLAFDIYAFHADPEFRQKLAFDTLVLAFIAGVLMSCAEELYEKGEITHKLRWGGNWDRDSIIIHDQSFDDLPHFELIKP